MKHEHYMRQALKLAERARGRTSPNPMVGALVVKQNQIIGRGYHPQAGMPHAEVYALDEAGEKAVEATLYVTLEPCCHQGRTPPCTERIIQAGIAHVVVATLDPNPIMSGKGIKCLEAAGINVVTGILKREAQKQNEVFFKFMKTGLPFVTAKWAMSLDGKIATKTGMSKWISGETARRIAHHLRDINDAILVGAKTVLVDNPRLTTRLPEGGQNPIRVVLDTFCEIPPESRVICSDSPSKAIIFCGRLPENKTKMERLVEAGAEVICVSNNAEMLNLHEVLIELTKREITSVLVEGGGNVHASFIEQKLVDKFEIFVAPKIIGGKEAPTPVEGEGFEGVDNVCLRSIESRKVGRDIWITAYTEGTDVYRNS